MISKPTIRHGGRASRPRLGLLISLLAFAPVCSEGIALAQKSDQPSSPPFTSLEKATVEARTRGNSRMFVFLGAQKCGDCDRMNALIIPARGFQDYMEDKVFVMLDLGSREGAEFAAQYRIQAAPAWVVLTPDGLLSWVHKGITPQSKWFDGLMDSEMRWMHFQKALKDEESNPANFQLVLQNAQEAFRRRGDSLAEQKFLRLIEDPATPLPIREQALAYAASIEIDSNRSEEAARHLETLIRIGTDPALKEKAEIRMIEIEIRKGDLAGARKRYSRLEKSIPESKMKRELEELGRTLETLESRGGQKEVK